MTGPALFKIMPPPSNSQPAVSGQLQAQAPSIEQDSSDHNRYIVMFKEQPAGLATAQAAQQTVEKTNTIFTSLSISKDSLIHQYKWTSQGFAARLTVDQVEQLRKHPLVDHVAKDNYYKAIDYMPAVGISAFKNLLHMSGQTKPWGVDRVEGPLDGTGKTAWILDTGIDLNHPDLNVDQRRSTSFVVSESSVEDYHGHGSHVSGVIAAIDNTRDVVGVAAGANVVAVKVCDQFGGCYTSDVQAGVEYAAAHFTSGDVANLSLGFPASASGIPDLENSILTAANSGLKFTIAAGNEGQDANNKSPARVNHSNVWTVSAYRDGDQFVQTFDWNTPNCNPLQDPRLGSNYSNPPVDYAAPGESILSLWRNGGTLTTCGTSMAAPHVAGLLLVMGAEPNHSGFVSNDPDGDPDEIVSYRLQPSTLTASVQNDSPRLDWSSIIGAQSYEVYRKFETGNWVFVTNTTNTYYVDNVINSPDLETLAQPPYDYEDFYSYRVKAITTVGGDQYSNTEYFLFECTGIPCSNSVEH